jgi:ABC-type lipoprotein export system ATPase subunit
MMVTHNEAYAQCGDLIIRVRSGRIIDVHEQPHPRQPRELAE